MVRRHCDWTLIIGTALLAVVQVASQNRVEPRLVSTWSELEFDFPTPAERQNAIIQGKYVSGAGVPIDVEVDYRGRGQSKIFVTVPRFQPGVPITLGTLGPVRNGGPVITAYPDYSWQSSHGKNCDGITSVFRVATDECKRLWVLDTGRIGAEQLCRPQLLVFDLRSDRLIHRYKFPIAQVRTVMSLFVTPVVDVRDPGPVGRCENTMVYIADVTGFGILVYDLKRDHSWRTHNKLVYPHPPYGTFYVAGETFDLMDGVIGMALSPRDTSINQRSYGLFGNYYQPNANYVAPESHRILYFHALASVTENAVPLRVLDNSTMWEEDPESSPRSFVVSWCACSRSIYEDDNCCGISGNRQPRHAERCAGNGQEWQSLLRHAESVGPRLLGESVSQLWLHVCFLSNTGSIAVKFPGQSHGLHEAKH